MAHKVITWTRGKCYVQEVTKSGGIIYARTGKVEIGGHVWDGFERLGRVALDAGKYPNSSMYIDSKRGPVVNPWHHQMVPVAGSKPPQQRRAGILFHKATNPSDLEGCIGVGTIAGGKLTQSAAAMQKLWELAGGTKDTKAVIVTVQVVGERTPSAGTEAELIKDLTPYGG